MKRTAALIALIVATLIAGCADTTRDRNVHYSGFLGDYSKLVKGGDKQGQRRYVRPDVDWASYTKILLDPVMLWRGDESRSDGVTAHDAQAMLNFFHGVIYQDKESQGFEMVTSPMPGTLRVQVAMTKLDESNVAMDVVSRVTRVGHVVSSTGQTGYGETGFCRRSRDRSQSD